MADRLHLRILSYVDHWGGRLDKNVEEYYSLNLLRFQDVFDIMWPLSSIRATGEGFVPAFICRS